MFVTFDRVVIHKLVLFFLRERLPAMSRALSMRKKLVDKRNDLRFPGVKPKKIGKHLYSVCVEYLKAREARKSLQQSLRVKSGVNKVSARKRKTIIQKAKKLGRAVKELILLHTDAVFIETNKSGWDVFTDAIDFKACGKFSDAVLLSRHEREGRKVSFERTVSYSWNRQKWPGFVNHGKLRLVQHMVVKIEGRPGPVNDQTVAEAILPADDLAAMAQCVVDMRPYRFSPAGTFNLPLHLPGISTNVKKFINVFLNPNSRFSGVLPIEVVKLILKAMLSAPVFFSKHVCDHGLLQ